MFVRPTHRVFFAIRPPLAVARQIVSAAPWFDAAGRLLRPEHLHMTMDILDDVEAVDPRLVAMLRRIGDAVVVAPFAVAFDCAVGSHRSIALRARRRNAELEVLRRAIVAARGGVGLPSRHGYGFSPHMTLGYRDGPSFSEPIAPIGWRVDELVLIHSHLGRTRHDTLGRWPLTASASEQMTLI